MDTLINILLIEDDDDDIELLEEALKLHRVKYALDIVMAGDKVLDHLNSLSILPDVIVLDFNLPRLHGKEVLRQIKTTDSLQRIPVVVLTTSAAKEDIEYALQTGAARFVTKPTSMQGFAGIVSVITDSATNSSIELP